MIGPATDAQVAPVLPARCCKPPNQVGTASESKQLKPATTNIDVRWLPGTQNWERGLFDGSDEFKSRSNNRNIINNNMTLSNSFPLHSASAAIPPSKATTATPSVSKKRGKRSFDGQLS
eukprot:scaffold248751_cov36-Prasinocladus_malaysianus.AAC.2